MVRHGRRLEHTLAVWSVKLAPDLRRAVLEEGVRRVEEFARRYVLAELVWPGRATPFLNVNTPAELSVAAHRLSESRLGQLDHVPVDDELAGILEVDGDAMADHRLDLAQPPIRPTRVTHEIAGREERVTRLVEQVFVTQAMVTIAAV